jgi:hypothetical protein
LRFLPRSLSANFPYTHNVSELNTLDQCGGGKVHSITGIIIFSIFVIPLLEKTARNLIERAASTSSSEGWLELGAALRALHVERAMPHHF